MRTLRRLVVNPLIVKDGLSRMRSWRAPAVIAVYLVLLGLFAWLAFSVELTGFQRAYGFARVGSQVFTALAVVQLALVCLFTPGVAAGAISGERERQTLDVLLVSCVPTFSIVWGKLVASVAFMLLLILSALPLFAAVFLFGGIDFEQFLVTQLLTVTTAVTIGAVSLFLSAVFRRTLPSTVAAYGVAFAGMVGTLFVGVLFTFAILLRASSSGGLGSQADVHPLLFTNPFYALEVTLTNPNGAPMHVGRLIQLLFLGIGQPNSAGPVFEPWQGTLLAQIGLVALSLFGAVQLVKSRRAPAPRRPLEQPVETAQQGSEA